MKERRNPAPAAAQPKKYNLNNILNADEFGLFPSAASKSIIASAVLPGHRKARYRAKFLVCTNIDETERISRLMVGRAQRPQCFGGVTQKSWVYTMVMEKNDR